MTDTSTDLRARNIAQRYTSVYCAGRTRCQVLIGVEEIIIVAKDRRHHWLSHIGWEQTHRYCICHRVVAVARVIPCQHNIAKCCLCPGIMVVFSTRLKGIVTWHLSNITLDIRLIFIESVGSVGKQAKKQAKKQPVNTTCKEINIEDSIDSCALTDLLGPTFNNSYLPTCIIS